MRQCAKKMQTYLNWIWTGFWFRTPFLEHLDLWDCSCGVQSSQPSLKISLATRLNHSLLPLPRNEFARENCFLAELLPARRRIPRGAWAEQKSCIAWFALDSSTQKTFLELAVSDFILMVFEIKQIKKKKKPPPTDSNQEAVSLATLGCCSCPGLSSSGHSPSHWPTPREAPFNILKHVAPPTQQSSL